MVRYYNPPMEPERSTAFPSQHRSLRWAGAGCALILTGLAMASYVGERRRLDDFRAQAIAAGFAEDAVLLGDLARKTDSHRAALQVARAILARDLTPNPPVPRGAQLERARDLGREALAAHPAAWQAPMIFGAATYLEWSITRDGRLFRQAERWQTPLLRSLDLGPGRTEPTQFLASAYLELWPALSADRRREARRLVGRAMADPKHFGRLLEPWLERAEDRQDAFDLIPEDTQAWDAVARYFLEQREWPAFVEARDRGFEVQKATARGLLEEAEVHLAGRDLRGARHLFLSAAMVAPQSLDMDPLIDEALAKAPAGPFNPHYAAGLGQQLDRALYLSLHRQAPLKASVIARLAVASGELPSPDRALAALAAEDLPGAELIARRADAQPWTPEWSPYNIARARVLLQRGDLPGAATALHEAEAGWRLEPVYWLVQRELSRRAGDTEGEARAEEWLQSFKPENRGARAWHVVDPRRQRLTFWGEAEPTEISLELSQQPPGGGAVAIHLDGQPVRRWALPTSAPLRFAVDADHSEIHVLEFENLAGGSVLPGRLRVSPAPR